VDQRNGNQVGSVVVTRARVCTLDEWTDPHGDVLGAGHPGLCVAQRGAQTTAGVDSGLVLGGEGAKSAAVAAKHAADHRVLS
jgi:hypothetical protein